MKTLTISPKKTKRVIALNKTETENKYNDNWRSRHKGVVAELKERKAISINNILTDVLKVRNMPKLRKEFS